MPDRRRNRPDMAAAVWLDREYIRKADECAAMLAARPGWTGRSSRVEAVRVAIDELHDHLAENTAAAAPLPA